MRKLMMAVVFMGLAIPAMAQQNAEYKAIFYKSLATAETKGSCQALNAAREGSDQQQKETMSAALVAAWMDQTTKEAVIGDFNQIHLLCQLYPFGNIYAAANIVIKQYNKGN